MSSNLRGYNALPGAWPSSGKCVGRHRGILPLLSVFPSPRVEEHWVIDGRELSTRMFVRRPGSSTAHDISRTMAISEQQLYVINNNHAAAASTMITAHHMISCVLLRQVRKHAWGRAQCQDGEHGCKSI